MLRCKYWLTRPPASWTGRTRRSGTETDTGTWQNAMKHGGDSTSPCHFRGKIKGAWAPQDIILSHGVITDSRLAARGSNDAGGYPKSPQTSPCPTGRRDCEQPCRCWEQVPPLPRDQSTTKQSCDYQTLAHSFQEHCPATAWPPRQEWVQPGSLEPLAARPWEQAHRERNRSRSTPHSRGWQLGTTEFGGRGTVRGACWCMTTCSQTVK